MFNLWAMVGAVATSLALSFAKRMDASVVSAPLFRKLQPLITLVGGIFAPFLAGQGVTDPTVLTTAPLATVAAIVLAELHGLLYRPK